MNLHPFTSSYSKSFLSHRLLYHSEYPSNHEAETFREAEKFDKEFKNKTGQMRSDIDALKQQELVPAFTPLYQNGQKEVLGLYVGKVFHPVYDKKGNFIEAKDEEGNYKKLTWGEVKGLPASPKNATQERREIRKARRAQRKQERMEKKKEKKGNKEDKEEREEVQASQGTEGEEQSETNVIQPEAQGDVQPIGTPATVEFFVEPIAENEPNSVPQADPVAPTPSEEAPSNSSVDSVEHGSSTPKKESSWESNLELKNQVKQMVDSIDRQMNQAIISNKADLDPFLSRIAEMGANYKSGTFDIVAGEVFTLLSQVIGLKLNGELPLQARALQLWLKKQNQDVKVDGKFGPESLNALIATVASLMPPDSENSEETEEGANEDSEDHGFDDEAIASFQELFKEAGLPGPTPENLKDLSIMYEISLKNGKNPTTGNLTREMVTFTLVKKKLNRNMKVEDYMERMFAIKAEYRKSHPEMAKKHVPQEYVIEAFEKLENLTPSNNQANTTEPKKDVKTEDPNSKILESLQNESKEKYHQWKKLSDAYKNAPDYAKKFLKAKLEEADEKYARARADVVAFEEKMAS